MIKSDRRRGYRLCFLAFHLDRYSWRPLLLAYLLPRWRVGLVRLLAIADVDHCGFKTVFTVEPALA